jgi:hypothetical protein
MSLQDFTVLPTEKFRRCVIRSSSVIFFTDIITDGLHPSAFLSSVIPPSIAISIGKTKKPFADGFTDGICAPKKRFPLEIY